MSGAIKKPSSSNRLVVGDHGRRPYAADTDYYDQMTLRTQKELDEKTVIKQSEFEKPYREED